MADLDKGTDSAPLVKSKYFDTASSNGKSPDVPVQPFCSRLESRLTKMEASDVLQNRARKIQEELSSMADFLVFDTETTGISSSDVIVQIAWAVYGPDGSNMKHCTVYWKTPPGIRISSNALSVHKITNEFITSNGQDPLPHIIEFFALVYVMRARGRRVVAHNASFDVRMLNQTCQKWGVKAAMDRDDFFCTMRAAMPHCGLVNKVGRPKAPRNSELFHYLSGVTCDEKLLHDAQADIALTASSYRLGRERRWWD